ncbi:hypothetical protein Dda_0222 [Drechslerella dactyloides]|uniref:Uncharacterized protein n=1 Tax=Drechslerella dactyloides TaxID=74499 RepID=A0AAD6J4R8_DREDA|nr:hypothetical protein Dda_0222 [Drechslerella dactyloides]
MHNLRDRRCIPSNISSETTRHDMAAAWMNNPYWNLDLKLTSTIASTLAETTATSVSTSVTKLTSTSPAIPLSTLVFRTGSADEMSKGSDKPPFAFNPLVLRLREAVNAYIARVTAYLASGNFGSYVHLALRAAKTLTWVVAVLMTAFIAMEVGWVVYNSYLNSRIPKDPTKGPVIPTDPRDPIGFPLPPDDATPPPKEDSDVASTTRRDVRVKLFSEILTGYLTLILSVSVLLGDSLVLQFLLSGLTGFVGMVAVMLPDEAEWSRRLYDYGEGGFEMRSMLLQPGDEAFRPEEVYNPEYTKPIATTKSTANTRAVVEIGSCSLERRKEVQTRVADFAGKTEGKIKEVREKVAERLHDAAAATRNIRDSITQKAATTGTPQITVTRAIEEDDLSVPANEDLKAQLTRVMAPVRGVLDTDRTMEQASKKVEAWLMKAGDAFGADGYPSSEIEDEHQDVKGKGRDRRPSFISGEGGKDGAADGTTLRLR